MKPKIKLPVYTHSYVCTYADVRIWSTEASSYSLTARIAVVSQSADMPRDATLCALHNASFEIETREKYSVAKDSKTRLCVHTYLRRHVYTVCSHGMGFHRHTYGLPVFPSMGSKGAGRMVAVLSWY